MTSYIHSNRTTLKIIRINQKAGYELTMLILFLGSNQLLIWTAVCGEHRVIKTCTRSRSVSAYTESISGCFSSTLILNDSSGVEFAASLTTLRTRKSSLWSIKIFKMAIIADGTTFVTELKNHLVQFKSWRYSKWERFLTKTEIYVQMRPRSVDATES